jgi:hypothetical protein
MSVGRAVALVGAVLCLALAIIVLGQMSSEALAVASGVVCGVAAGIPAAILLYVTLSRRARRVEDEPRPGQQGAYPPLIIVQGYAGPTPLAQDPWLAPPDEDKPRSQVRLVGGEDLLPGEGQDKGS